MGASHLHVFPPQTSEIHMSRLMPLECLFSESWKLQGIQENSTEYDGKHMTSVWLIQEKFKIYVGTREPHLRFSPNEDGVFKHCHILFLSWASSCPDNMIFFLKQDHQQGRCSLSGLGCLVWRTTPARTTAEARWHVCNVELDALMTPQYPLVHPF